MFETISVFWLIVAIVSGILEAVTVSLFSLWFMIGAVVAFLFSLFFPQGIYADIVIYCFFGIIIVFYTTSGEKICKRYY